MYLVNDVYYKGIVNIYFKLFSVEVMLIFILWCLVLKYYKWLLYIYSIEVLLIYVFN